MVPFASGNQFEAQLLAARLGAEGVVWQMRGACSVYPFGTVDVLVDVDDLERARELLLVDEIEAVFDPAPPPPARAHRRRSDWVAWAAAGSIFGGVAIRLLSAIWP
jgi:hypothetical protein